MKFQTLSVLAGTEVCTASCPFCVSRMTGMNKIGKRVVEINRRNMKKAYALAWRSGVNTVIITGKGEPTIYPEHIDAYLHGMAGDYEFPFVELQTNGDMIAYHNQENKQVSLQRLEQWYELGLTTILLSIVHYNPERNKEIYFPNRELYLDVYAICEAVHKIGLNVRFCCVGVDGYIDTPKELENFMQFADACGVNQITWRPVTEARSSEDMSVAKWTKEHQVSDTKRLEIKAFADEYGEVVRNLPHGAKVYDINGQNVCLSDCLTRSPDPEDQRQLIFFPDGRIYTDWSLRGSILL